MSTVSAKNVRDVPKFEYFHLPESVRPAARQAVLDEEVKAVNRSMEEIRTVAKQNINLLIGNRYLNIRNIQRHKRRINDLVSDVKRLEGNIDDNYCQFLADGTYVLFMS